MTQTHYLWSPFHYSNTGEANPPRTYYLVVEDSELEKWETAGRNDLVLSEWKNTTSKVYQHLHLHEHPLQALNYVLSMINNSKSTTIVPVNERLHLIAVNLYPKTTVERNLLHYYQRDGTDYMELENHSNALRDMTKVTTSTVIISGPTYDDVIQMMTPRFYSNHLIDTTVVSGPDYIDYKSAQNMYNRHYDKAIEFLQKMKPDYIHVLQEDDTTKETTTGTTSFSKKKGVRTTTITLDYGMEIVVKHVKRA